MLDNVRKWQGLILISTIASSTLWLAATDQLELYVAPRHTVFATTMSIVGLIAALASAVRLTTDHHALALSPWARLTATAATSVALFAAGTLLALPPATLTSATANQRDINSTAVGDGGTALADASEASSDTFAGFSILDWASLLKQTSDAGFYEDKAVVAVGFISEDPEDPDNMFYVSRFLVTHCAIDAQPVGVPVYLENWKNTFEPDQWIETSGGLTTNRSQMSGQPIVLVPDDVTGIEQPEDPYLYG